MKRLVLFLLTKIDVKEVLAYVLEWLIGISRDKIYELLDRAFDYALEADRKYGHGRGREKLEYVKSKLKEIYPDVAEYILNLIIEIAVTYLKKSVRK